MCKNEVRTILFRTINHPNGTEMVATFGSKGSPTRQEVVFDLLFFCRPPQNLGSIEKYDDGCSERSGCNFPLFQNEFFRKDATKYFLLSLPIRLPVIRYYVLQNWNCIVNVVFIRC